MQPKPKTIVILLSIVLLLLLIPLIAMQFTKEVNWSLIDFAVAGVLLFGTCFAIEFVLRKVKTRKNRVIICGIIILLILLLWIELAVGIIGNSFASN